jgi:ubiquinol-cytochrome c reductase cytochrome b subunit
VNQIAHNTIVWIDNRTGLQTAIRSFFLEEVPASTGWPQVFGSIALFLFVSQAVTGILLAFNYSPGPGDAYSSVTYIVHQVAAGRIVRGLHHWGSTLMIIVVACHMCQVFIYGAYKKPREVTWMLGVVLFLLTLAFWLTGYLLPWDNKAYWGTVVTTQLVQQAPVAGPYLITLIGAANGVGALTFARFYALHTLVIPALMIFTVAAHLALVRRHGVMPAVPEDQAKRAFYPHQLFRDVVAIFIAFLALFLAAALIDVPLERMADPTDTTYVPRPEWYFLFLFQSLKFFHGPFEVVGSVGLPTVAILALLAIPFVDRGRMRKLTERTAAIAVALVAVAGWSALTVAAVASTPNSVTLSAPSTLDRKLVAQGAALYVKAGCDSCHRVNGLGGHIGPALNGVTKRRSKEWLERHFVAPSALSPGSIMPPYRFSKEDQDALVTYLFSLPD